MSKSTKTIEQKMKELRELVAWFDSEAFALEQASAKFEAAASLAREIEHELTEMKNTVTVLKQSFEDDA